MFVVAENHQPISSVGALSLPTNVLKIHPHQKHISCRIPR